MCRSTSPLCHGHLPQPQLADRAVLVGGVLEDDAEGVVDRLVVEVVDLQRDQRARPVDGLRDGRRLLELELAQPADGGDELLGDLGLELGHLRQHDLPLAGGVRVVEVQVEAAPLEGLRQLAARVGGEDDQRAAYGDDGAELGDGHLEVREHLEQQPLDLDVGLVDLVDEQHGRLLAADRGQQRPGEQELLAEDVVVRLGPLAVLGRWPGCAAAASCSSTRRAPAPRRAPRSTGAGPGPRRSPAPRPWRARSCRRRPVPRRAAASRGRRRGTSWSRWSGRRGSRPRPAGCRRRRVRRTTSCGHLRSRLRGRTPAGMSSLTS